MSPVWCCQHAAATAEPRNASRHACVGVPWCDTARRVSERERMYYVCRVMYVSCIAHRSRAQFHTISPAISPRHRQNHHARTTEKPLPQLPHNTPRPLHPPTPLSASHQTRSRAAAAAAALPCMHLQAPLPHFWCAITQRPESARHCGTLAATSLSDQRTGGGERDQRVEHADTRTHSGAFHKAELHGNNISGFVFEPRLLAGPRKCFRFMECQLAGSECERAI